VRRRRRRRASRGDTAFALSLPLLFFFFFFFFDDDDARARETDDTSVHHATSSYPRAETTRRMDDGDGDARGWGRRDSMGEREEPSRASSVVLAEGVVGADDR